MTAAALPGLPEVVVAHLSQLPEPDIALATEHLSDYIPWVTHKVKLALMLAVVNRMKAGGA
jgi:hypothetical protein